MIKFQTSQFTDIELVHLALIRLCFEEASIQTIPLVPTVVLEVTEGKAGR